MNPPKAVFLLSGLLALSCESPPTGTGSPSITLKPMVVGTVETWVRPRRLLDSTALSPQWLSYLRDTLGNPILWFDSLTLEGNSMRLFLASDYARPRSPNPDGRSPGLFNSVAPHLALQGEAVRHGDSLTFPFMDSAACAGSPSPQVDRVVPGRLRFCLDGTDRMIQATGCAVALSRDPGGNVGYDYWYGFPCQRSRLDTALEEADTVRMVDYRVLFQ